MLLRRIAKMSPAEIRPVGNNPDDWEADLPEANPKQGDVYSHPASYDVSRESEAIPGPGSAVYIFCAIYIYMYVV